MTGSNLLVDMNPPVLSKSLIRVFVLGVLDGRGRGYANILATSVSSYTVKTFKLICNSGSIVDYGNESSRHIRLSRSSALSVLCCCFSFCLCFYVKNNSSLMLRETLVLLSVIMAIRAKIKPFIYILLVSL